MRGPLNRFLFGEDPPVVDAARAPTPRRTVDHRRKTGSAVDEDDDDDDAKRFVILFTERLRFAPTKSLFGMGGFPARKEEYEDKPVCAVSPE